MSIYKYMPTLWQGGKTIGTADIMNNMENGIVKAHERLDTINNNCFKTITLTSQTINSLDVINGAVYRVNGIDVVTINDVVNSESGTHFYLLLASNDVGSIVVKSGTNITVPGGTYTISVANKNNDVLIEFIKVDGSTFRLRK